MALFCSLLFCALQLFFVWNGGENEVFNSPDAMANYHFAKRLYEGKPLPVLLPFSPAPEVHYLAPRSTRVIDNKVIPVGFLGLIFLYGLVSAVLFMNIIPYLTVIIAGLALMAMFEIVSEYSSRKEGLWALILLALHPGFWYYTNESLMPNVLFVSLCIFTALFALRAYSTARAMYFVLAGFTLALSLFVRLSEGLWLVPIVFFLLIFFKGKVSWKKVALGAVTFCTVLLVAVIFQYSILSFNVSVPVGYALPTTAGTHVSSFLTRIALPFGFHPRLILNYVTEYGMLMFWPYTVLAFAGAILLYGRPKKISRAWLLYGGVFMFMGTILALVYGSYQVFDYPDPLAVVISSSHVRYFLPIFVAAIPFAARCVMILTERLRSQIIGLCLIAFLLAFNFFIAFSHADVGIIAKARTLRSYDSLAGYIRDHIPESAIVITDKSDKYIWPSRIVMRTPRDEKDFETVAFFLNQRNIYYVGLISDSMTNEFLEKQFKDGGFFISEPLHEHEGIGIYTVFKSQNE